jgi:3',5'-nucleoside bisphosphate phosphatase
VTTLLPNRVDLHCHTDRSDGVQPPLELYEDMRRAGMRLVAVTDHDTLAGFRELHAAGLGRTADAAGPRLIPALEINTIAGEIMDRHGLGREGEELHILGFGVDPDDPTLEATLARQRASRGERFRRTVEQLRELGTPVDYHLAAIGDDSWALGRPHVARALIRAGYATSVDDAFDRFLDHGRPAYIPRLGLGPREAIDAIAAAGGLPVLAHAPAAPERADVIAELQDWGLVGLEVYYRSFSPDVVARMAAFAAERRLLPTGGSDYHGDLMGYADTQKLTYVPDEVGERLLEAIDASRRGRAAP